MVLPALGADWWVYALELEVLLPQLAAVQVREVQAGGDLIQIIARTRDGVAVACSGCGWLSDWVHSRYERHVADEAVGGRPVTVDLSVRRLYCENPGCSKTTFVEQVDGLTVRYQRRTPALQQLLSAVAAALVGKTAVRLLPHLHQLVSCSTLLTMLMALPLPVLPVPQVLGVDDFALRRGHRYATVLIDVITHARVDVLADRTAETLTAWLRAHPGVEVVCRDGSAGYAEGIRQGAPDAVQVSDRWHLWHNLAAAVEKTVAAHAACWRAVPPEATPGSRNARVLQTHAAVHASLETGVSLCETGRRLGLALNTVKRYARDRDPAQLIRPPQYRRCLVDPYRDHLRTRRAAGPVATTTLLAEIRVLGYTGSPNLLVRYLEQGRAEESLADPSVRRLTSWIMTDPDHLADEPGTHRDKLTAVCPEMTALTSHVTAFAKLLAHHEHPTTGHAALAEWIEAVNGDDLPALHAFVRGLQKDQDAVQAGLDLPYSNGATEGINNKTKLLKRQTYGRAGFALLRQRILLN
ncbi:transposase IS204/IS1001/IS1096/IS1165 family protein [Actinobacteria bacterium OK006]|nr:transposase IS204/IS1001/IS1096/IS1165 family protein [Actinobacteria bacterium OK006]